MFVELLTFALLVTATYSLPSRDVSDDPVVCETAACKSAADSILSHIDESVDPCEDWYLYACGNFAKVHPRPPQSKYIDALSLLYEANINRTIAALDDARFLTHGSKVVRKVKQLYDECVKKSDDHHTSETINKISRQILLERRKILIDRIANMEMGTFIPTKVPSIDEIMALQINRNDSCRLIVENKYYYAVTRMYLDMFMDMNATADARRMINNIHDAFINSVQVSWADVEEKIKYREQMKQLQRKLVYPDWIVDDAELDSEYEERVVESFDDLMVNKKHEPWVMEILEVNAFFIFSTNLIAIPAGILQGLLFNKDSAPAINHGGGGFVAGHEMSHGMSYYLNGTSRSASDACIIEQLVTVVEPQTKLRYATGKYLLEEMQADIGGMNATIIAMRDNVKQDIRLPGAAQKFTPMQLFFLSAANTWCHNTEDYRIATIILSALGHPFNYHRVVIPVINSPDFAEAFSCKPGTPMNPVEKCRRW